jgi:hypothetical protein
MADEVKPRRRLPFKFPIRGQDTPFEAAHLVKSRVEPFDQSKRNRSCLSGRLFAARRELFGKKRQNEGTMGFVSKGFGSKSSGNRGW